MDWYFWRFRDQRTWAQPMTCGKEYLHVELCEQKLCCVTCCSLQCQYKQMIKPWEDRKDGVTEKCTLCSKRLDHVYILLWPELSLEAMLRYIAYTVLWGHVYICGCAATRTMSEFMVLLQCIWSVWPILLPLTMWMFENCVAVWGHVDTHEPWYYQGLCRSK